MTSRPPKRANGGRRSEKIPTASGAATVSIRATVSSHAYSEEEPDAVTAPVRAHIATAAIDNATEPAREPKVMRISTPAEEPTAVLWRKATLDFMRTGGQRQAMGRPM